MEEVVVLVVQLIVEVFFNAAVCLPFDWMFGGKQQTARMTGCATIFLFAIFGAALGGLSLLVLPHLMLSLPGLRIMNLISAPLLAGLFALLIARYRGNHQDQWQHFWNNFCFTLCFAAIRLAYCQR